jgi:phospholipid-binding lipoprotein MlaA
VRIRLLLIAVLALAMTGCATARPASAPGGAPSNGRLEASTNAGELDELPLPGEEEVPLKISDPIRPVNKAFFHFNDKLYCWVIKPVAKGWGFIMPRPVRRGLDNFFNNLGVIVRTFNCTAQGDFKGSGNELARFGINTTIGVLGLWDPAQKWFGIKQRDEASGPAFSPRCPCTARRAFGTRSG